MSLEISQEELVKYLLKFYPSLRQYPDRYLPLVFEQYGEVPNHFAYLCPLCLENILYTQDTNWHYTESFSMDHYPPKNVGGKKKMMVCKPCNNTAGYSYEKCFKEQVLQVMKAILKTAYLHCFDYWGYDFVFSVAGQLFRDVLNDKASYPIPVPTLWYDNKAEIYKDIKIPTGMVYIDQSADLMSMFVHIEAEIKEMDYRCIIPVQIPHPDDKDFLDVKRIQQFFSDHPLHQIIIKPMPFEFTLAFPHPYTKSWEELNKLRT